MIITTFYEQGGTMHGMPVIHESGLCTDAAMTTNKLKEYEPGRLELVPIPRLTGIVAKSLDGWTIKTDTLDTPFGKFRNCLQLEKTLFRDFAPEQPFGQFKNKRILAYRRSWVQLTE